jgi:hypothetical protein
MESRAMCFPETQRDKKLLIAKPSAGFPRRHWGMLPSGLAPTRAIGRSRDIRAGDNAILDINSLSCC